jgi:hypothetical protein
MFSFGTPLHGIAYGFENETPYPRRCISRASERADETIDAMPRKKVGCTIFESNTVASALGEICGSDVSLHT